MNLHEQLHEEAIRILNAGQPEQALPLFRELAAYYKASEDYTNYVRAKTFMIICHFDLEQIRFVDEHVSDIEPYEAFLNPGDKHRYYMAQATLFYFWHDMDQCIAMYEKCFQFALTLKNSAAASTAANFATIYRELERFDDSFDILDRGLAHTKKLDPESRHTHYVISELYLGYAANYCLLGQYDQAGQYLRELEAMNYLRPEAAQMNTFKRWQAIVKYEEGLVDEGFALFAQQFKVMQKKGDYRVHKIHLKTWAQYAASHGRYKEAYEYTNVLNESLEEHLQEALLDRSSKYAAEFKTNDLRNLAFEDAMTHLHNRRLLMKLEKDFEQEPQMLTVMTLDIDHFKHINDTYGHAVGDDLIIEVAHILQRLMHHPQHHCIRFGGDEFIVVMQRPLEQANVWIERLYTEIQQTSFQFGDIELSITCSIGVASGKESLKVLTKQSDDNLYKAKAAGRNRLVGV